MSVKQEAESAAVAFLKELDKDLQYLSLRRLITLAILRGMMLESAHAQQVWKAMNKASPVALLQKQAN